MILIDHLKQVYIQGELEPLDTSVWYARLARKDYAVGMNVQGTGIDDPDVMFFENYTCGSERNYTAYCNPELEKLFHQQSHDDGRGRAPASWYGTSTRSCRRMARGRSYIRGRAAPAGGRR